ncbi:hypothetical protein F5887DRAFT_1184931 [Amanita rubescens]|nr:hypothetical protein F5887DRAFT_1184931 [Amanita rubescens]
MATRRSSRQHRAPMNPEQSIVPLVERGSGSNTPVTVGQDPGTPHDVTASDVSNSMVVVDGHDHNAVAERDVIMADPPITQESPAPTQPIPDESDGEEDVGVEALNEEHFQQMLSQATEFGYTFNPNTVVGESNAVAVAENSSEGVEGTWEPAPVEASTIDDNGVNMNDAEQQTTAVALALQKAPNDFILAVTLMNLGPEPSLDKLLRFFKRSTDTNTRALCQCLDLLPSEEVNVGTARKPVFIRNLAQLRGDPDIRYLFLGTLQEVQDEPGNRLEPCIDCPESDSYRRFPVSPIASSIPLLIVYFEYQGISSSHRVSVPATTSSMGSTSATPQKNTKLTLDTNVENYLEATIDPFLITIYHDHVLPHRQANKTYSSMILARIIETACGEVNANYEPGNARSHKHRTHNGPEVSLDDIVMFFGKKTPSHLRNVKGAVTAPSTFNNYRSWHSQAQKCLKKLKGKDILAQGNVKDAYDLTHTLLFTTLEEISGIEPRDQGSWISFMQRVQLLESVACDHVCWYPSGIAQKGKGELEMIGATTMRKPPPICDYKPLAVSHRMAPQKGKGGLEMIGATTMRKPSPICDYKPLAVSHWMRALYLAHQSVNKKRNKAWRVMTANVSDPQNVKSLEMDAQEHTKRTYTSADIEHEVRRKKQRIEVLWNWIQRDIYTEPKCPKAHVRDFLDIEASDGSSGDERVDSDDELCEDFIDNNEETLALGDAGDSEEDFEGYSDKGEGKSECSNALAVQSVNRPNFSRDFGLSDVINRYEAQAAAIGDYKSESVQSVNRPNFSRDFGLSDVINRYEAQAAVIRDYAESDLEHEMESDAENDVESEGDIEDHIKEITRLAERALRMPNEDDPGLWLDGAEEESFFLLEDRLKVRPRWAISVFLPPASRQWICVESTSREYVEELCQNLSTFPHPLQILPIPIDERLQWLGCRDTTPTIKAGTWIRVKKKHELKELLREDPKVDKGLVRYANDLGYVHRVFSDSLLAICLVPRLLVPIESDFVDEENRKICRRKRRCPRLLHPNLLRGHKDAVHVVDRLDPNVWWNPKTLYDMEPIVRGQGVYQLAKPNWKKTVKGGDNFLPPFAYYAVWPRSVCSVGVVPTINELKLFGEGMTVGAKQLQFPSPDLELIRWSFDNHVAAPVEIGQKVEIKSDARMMRGVIVDVHFNNVVVEVSDTEDKIEVDAKCVRRFYDVGDSVMVVKPSKQEREGWVVDVCDDELEIFDPHEKEKASECSQILFLNEFNFEASFMRKAGNLSRTIRMNMDLLVVGLSPISPHYQEMGQVCNVTELGIEVKGDVTKFCVPHWFLDVETRNDALEPAVSGGLETQLRYYDRYKELINTWVRVTGDNIYKGLFGRIRDHSGQQMMLIEPRWGGPAVNVHVDFLLNGEEGGRDLRLYHVGLYETPATKGCQIQFPGRSEPEKSTTPGRSTTPGADDDPNAFDLTQEERAERTTTSGESETVGEQPATVTGLPQLEKEVSMISYGDQVLSADWLMKNGLVNKRIWVYVRNTGFNPFEQGGGYARGYYEGERALILSCEGEDKIEVNLKQQTIIIPSRFLFPDIPTTRGQDVVVIDGDKAGEAYLTRKPNHDGTFPLGRRGHKGTSQKLWFIYTLQTAETTSYSGIYGIIGDQIGDEEETESGSDNEGEFDETTHYAREPATPSLQYLLPNGPRARCAPFKPSHLHYNHKTAYTTTNVPLCSTTNNKRSQSPRSNSSSITTTTFRFVPQPTINVRSHRVLTRRVQPQQQNRPKKIRDAVQRRKRLRRKEGEEGGIVRVMTVPQCDPKRLRRKEGEEGGIVRVMTVPHQNITGIESDGYDADPEDNSTQADVSADGYDADNEDNDTDTLCFIRQYSLEVTSVEQDDGYDADEEDI